MNNEKHATPRHCRRIQQAIATALCLGALIGSGSAPAQASRATVALSQAAADHDLRDRFDEAMLAYERNQWSLAFMLLSNLADLGHAEASRVALQMWRYGPALYGSSFVATSQQVANWSQTWACSGDAAGRGCMQALKAP